MVPHAAYCGHCGKAQPNAYAYHYTRPSYPAASPLGNMSPRAASILCYIPVFGVIPAIIILAAHQFRRDNHVRFNAFQSVYLFVAWLVVKAALSLPGFGVEHILLELVKLGFFICWIVLLVKAAQNQPMHLPIIGDLAARSATEQL